LTSFHLKPLDESTWPDFCSTGREASGTELCRRIEPRRNGEFGTAGLTPPSCTTVRRPSAGVSSGRQTSFRASRISELISMVSPTFQIGGSPAFSLTGIIGARGSPPSLLKGALREISRLGGGTVESYPEDVEGRPVSASFLHNGNISMFEREGFKRSRRLGKNHWVVTKVVRKSSRKGSPAQS